MEKPLIRCTCSMPHLCAEREPNRTHGLVDYAPVKPDADQTERFRQLDEIYKDGVPHYQSAEAARSTAIFKECVKPFYSGNW